MDQPLKMTTIQIKLEPEETFNVEVNLKIEHDKEEDTPFESTTYSDNFVAIKQEHIPQDIKIEPPDQDDPYESPQEEILPDNLIIKLDPSSYPPQILNNYDRPARSTPRVQRNLSDTDDEYLPPKSKKKKKKEPNVKPLFRGKPRNTGKSRAEYMREYRQKKREEELKLEGQAELKRIARSSTQRSRDFRARERARANSILATANPSNALSNLTVSRSTSRSSFSSTATSCNSDPVEMPLPIDVKQVKVELEQIAHDEQKYPDDITKHIEIVTIDEAERALEHHELFSSRKHMNYTCESCALGFVIEDAYHMHMKIHSPENGAHQCDICQARMKTADVLYRHKLRHYRRYRCCICRLQLRDKDTVAAHVMQEHIGTAFLCKHCGRGFKRPQYLKRHVEQMHTKPLHLECPVCQRVFYERGWYRCHVRTHNEEVRKNVDRKAICYHCGREFKNKAYLVRHLQTHEDRRPVDCKHCSRTFKNIEVLRVHYRQHHSKNPLNEDGTFNENFTGRTYASQGRIRGPGVNTTCAQCGRVLTTRAMLMRHTQRMHTERVRKFQCDYCKKWYFTKAEVRSHIEWTHLQQRRHACACGRVFRTPARLRAHACSVHLRIAPPRDKACPVCGKKFANQQVLTRHIKGHSGELYPCNECGQKFKTQSYVKVHYKLKHLKMTRAEIKAETKRKLIMVENPDEIMNAKVKSTSGSTINKEDPLEIGDEIKNIEIKKETPDDIQVPLFETFVDIQREC